MLAVTFIGCALPPVLSAQAVGPAPAERPAGAAPAQKNQPTEPSNPIIITLGEPQQIFQFRRPDSMGLFNVPDMHTAVLQQHDQSYLLWITGNIGPSGGSIARLSTKVFSTMRMPDPAHRGARSRS